MTTDHESRRTATDEQIVAWLHDCLAEHRRAVPAPSRTEVAVTNRVGEFGRTPRMMRGVALVAMLVLLAGTSAMLIIARSGAPASTVVPQSAISSPAPVHVPDVSVPGITATKSGQPTLESQAFAQRVTVALDVGFGGVKVREHATRSLESGSRVEWVYFEDGERRLLIVEGPSGVLDSAQLTRTTDGLVWPDEQGASTVALASATTTIIVRSESNSPRGAVRSSDELLQIARLVGAVATG